MTTIELIWQAVMIIIIGIASIKDIGTMEIPVLPVIAAIGARVFFLAYDGSYLPYILPACILFLAFIFFALISNFGGGDSIIAGMLGLYMGVYGFYATMLACVMSISFLLVRQKLTKDNRFSNYPFVPFMFFGAVVSEMIRLGVNL